MFISMYTKQNFLVCISHLYDSLIQTYWLKAKPIPMLTTERRMPRYPEEELVNSPADVPIPTEVVYTFINNLGADAPEAEIREFIFKLLKSIQYHPDEVVDLEALQVAANEVVDKEIERFKRAEKAEKRKATV